MTIKSITIEITGPTRARQRRPWCSIRLPSATSTSATSRSPRRASSGSRCATLPGLRSPERSRASETPMSIRAPDRRPGHRNGSRSPRCEDRRGRARSSTRSRRCRSPTLCRSCCGSCSSRRPASRSWSSRRKARPRRRSARASRARPRACGRPRADSATPSASRPERRAGIVSDTVRDHDVGIHLSIGPDGRVVVSGLHSGIPLTVAVLDELGSRARERLRHVGVGRVEDDRAPFDGGRRAC